MSEPVFTVDALELIHSLALHGQNINKIRGALHTQEGMWFNDAAIIAAGKMFGLTIVSMNAGGPKTEAVAAAPERLMRPNASPTRSDRSSPGRTKFLLAGIGSEAHVADVRVIHGDMLGELPKLQSDSIDSCVTDPPYHLQSIHKRLAAYGRHATGFMGKQWDGGDVAFQAATWDEVFRVLKPGAHLLAFGGTRTYHRLVCAIEAAGFEVRDTIGWLFGSGFPKSLDVSKAIDKAAGATREVVGQRDRYRDGAIRQNLGQTGGEFLGLPNGVADMTAPATPEAEQWQGWGTALKPAMELICVARKPLGERTVAANVLRHGTGAINVDGCRVETSGTDQNIRSSPTKSNGLNSCFGVGNVSYARGPAEGRWPANMMHDGSDEVEAAFAAYGERGANGGLGEFKQHAWMGADIPQSVDRSKGTVSRFFYSAKADAADRLQSRHPTVKPVDLIAWLVRLITPPGGVVLDCFAGSGTTGMAAMAEGFNAILIEREAEYVADIQRRLDHVEGADTPLFAEVRNA